MTDDSRRASASTVYSELCERLRFTDEISFKLLGFVPLVSGATFAVVLLKGDSFLSPAVYYLSALGALITLCLFGWELRNLKTCNHLCHRIDSFPGANPTYENEAPWLIGKKGRIGKTQVEKLLYSVLTLSWLTLPYAACSIAAERADEASKPNCLNLPVWWLVVVAASFLVVLLFLMVDVKSSKKSESEASTEAPLSEETATHGQEH